MERIHKLIGNSGLYSRRKAEELIKEGRVTKNGNVVELGDTATWNDVIKVDDKKIKPNKKYYYVINKPRGVISSTVDDKNRPTVIDLIENAPRGLHPIGRLDYDTTGLLILTTDGEVTNLLSNSESHVPKTYIVKTKDKLTKQQILKLSNGVFVNGVKTRRAKVKPLKREWSDNFIRLTITEGKYHQVKLMVEAVGSKVVKLHRERIGNMDVGILQSGVYKKLALEELKSNIGYEYFEVSKSEVDSKRERVVKMKAKNKWAKAKRVTKRQSSRNKKMEKARQIEKKIANKAMS